LIIEVKLWSGKSGHREQDQLNRYLKILEDKNFLDDRGVNTNSFICPGLIYLTPRESKSDLAGSIECAEESLGAKKKLFAVRWQDIFLGATRVSSLDEIDEPFKSMFGSVAKYLNRRGLIYFDGFTIEYIDINIDKRDMIFYSHESTFEGFSEEISEPISSTESDYYQLTIRNFKGFNEVTLVDLEGSDINFYERRAIK